MGKGFDKQDNFAADAIAGGQVGSGSGDRGAQKLLVDLGEFASDDDAQIGPPDGFEIGKCVQNSMGRLIKNQGAGCFGFPGFFGQGFETAAACSGLFRQEADELELVRGQA